MITLEQMEELDKTRTQGEWTISTAVREYGPDEVIVAGKTEIWAMNDKNDAPFIAACSTWVPWAIEKIKDLESWIAKAWGDVPAALARLKELEARVSQMAQEDMDSHTRIAKLEEALRWYADEGNYYDGIMYDEGRRAREALDAPLSPKD